MRRESALGDGSASPLGDLTLALSLPPLCFLLANGFGWSWALSRPIYISHLSPPAAPGRGATLRHAALPFVTKWGSVGGTCTCRSDTCAPLPVTGGRAGRRHIKLLVSGGEGEGGGGCRAATSPGRDASTATGSHHSIGMSQGCIGRVEAAILLARETVNAKHVG